MEGKSEDINHVATDEGNIVNIADIVINFLGNDVNVLMEEKNHVESVLEKQEVQPDWDNLKFGGSSNEPQGFVEANPVISELMNLAGPIIHKFQVRNSKYLLMM